MKNRRVDRIVYAAVAALLIGSCLYSALRYSDYVAEWQEFDATQSVDDHVAHADLYYWFGMCDRGGMSSVKYGLGQVEKAKHKLADSSLSQNERVRLEAKIAGIETDLTNQKILYHDTLKGVFEWGHYVAKPTMFSGKRATGIYELVDQPEVVAMRDAVSGLIDDVIKQQSFVPQYDVLFISEPHDKQLENEALYLFNRSARFFVNNYHGVNSTLTAEEQQKIRDLEPDANILRKLRQSFGHNDILFVRTKKVDSYKHYYFYVAQGRVFSGDNPQPTVVLNNYGFCRERNSMLVPLLSFNLLMLLTAIVGFRLLAQHSAHDLQPPTWTNTLGLAIIGFLWGRTVVWGLAELVEEVMPPDETLAVLAWWWPVLTGIVMLFGPALILRFAENRFGWLSSRFGTFNRGGALFVAISLGSFTYCGQAALYINTWSGWQMLLPLFIVTVLLAYLIGRALDPTDPVQGKWGIAALLLALCVGPAYCNPNPLNLWILAVPVVALSKLTLCRSQLLKAASIEAAETESPDADPGSIKALQRKAFQPPFQKTATFDVAWTALSPWLNSGRAVRIELTGKAGTGKTALIKAIVRASQAAHCEIAILEGACPEPQDGQIAESYRPIADAIANHFAVNLLAPRESQMLKIDKAVDGIFEEVVPFSDLLFPESEHGASGSKSELFHSVVAMLRRLATKRRVLLIVDDTHWIDPGSRDLLNYLLKEIPAAELRPIGLLGSGGAWQHRDHHGESVGDRTGRFARVNRAGKADERRSANAALRRTEFFRSTCRSTIGRRFRTRRQLALAVSDGVVFGCA